ncbi:TetR/AcrR family transcriptional regulator [Actinomadura sp. HBU206391]|nr:TetR/AcrR family transcriptional regulator [Actinomadura sp. HBU206391]
MPRPERERQMLDIAEEVFAEQGYRAASMDDIAERVGVSKPMLYEYFGSKDGLLSACVARIRTDLYEATQEAMAGAASPEDVLWRGLLAYFTFMDRHNRALAVIAQQPMLIPAAAADAIEATRRQQSGLTATLLAAFAPDASPRAVEAYAEIIIGACERVSIWQARHPEVTPEEAARHVMDFSWRGLRDAAASPGP